MGTHLNRYEDTPLMKGWSLRESIKGMSSITKSLREADNGLEEKLKNRKQSITVHLNRKRMVCSAKKYSDQPRTGNVIAENIKESDIKE